MSYENTIEVPDAEDEEASSEPHGLRMSDDEIVAFIRDRESRASRLEINEEQAEAMDAYLRRPYGNEEDGRSQVISSDVFDVVEGLAPIVLEPFVTSSDLVQFTAQGPDDEEAAKQESDYLNFVMTQKNDAFTQFLAWVKAGLLQKNGVVKWWWDHTHRVSLEVYRGITADVLQSFMANPDATIVGLTTHPPAPQIPDMSLQPIAAAAQQATQGPAGTPAMPSQGAQQAAPPQPEGETYDVRLRIRKRDGFARFKVVPPESLLVIGDDPNIQNSRFVQHRELVTLSDLREMGYDVDDDLSDGGEGDTTNTPTFTARTQETDSFHQGADDSIGDPSMRQVWYRESYCYLDLDGDGIAELRKICQVGSHVLDKDETEEIPFAGWTPYLQLFQYDGRCPADEAMEFQEVKTTLWRQALDNLYTINNNRVYAGNKVDLSDLLDNQIAGIVRVDAADIRGQIYQAEVQPLGGIIQPMIEYADSAKENRTGFTRYNQGNDAESLNKTATGVRIITQAGNKRTGLIVRSLAEQGVRPLMLGMHGLLRRHATRAETVRLRGKWVTIDPRGWAQRYDATGGGGLGSMDKQLELSAQQEILKMQAGLAPAGIVSPENQYAAAARYVELTGEKNPDKYFTHPDKMPAKQQPDPMQNPEVMLKVAGQKLDQQKFERESAQKDRQLDQADRALDQVDQKQGIEDATAQLDALERHHNLQMATEKHMRDMQAPHPQALAAGDQALQAQQQGHQQQVDAANVAQGDKQLELQANPPASPEAGSDDAGV